MNGNEAAHLTDSKYLRQASIAPKLGPVEDSELFQIFAANTGHLIHKWVHYFQIYERHFSRFKNQPVNILEIGVFRGGSLQLWQSYFGNKANIYGMDIDPSTKAFEDERVKIFIGDQANPEFLKDVKAQLPPMDIIIDDGGHTTQQQITSFLELYDQVTPNGVYLVEDLHTNYWPRFIDTPNGETFIDFAKRHIDALNAWYYQGEETYHRYAQNPYQRNGQISVPEFTLTTHSISFYNSIIVFEKQPVLEPFVYATGQ